MRFLTANEELEVERLRSTSRQEFRIGSHFCGVQYRGQRPKYVMLTNEDIGRLHREFILRPAEMTRWLANLKIALLPSKDRSYAENDS